MRISKWTESERNQIKEAHEKANNLFPQGYKLSIFRKKGAGDLIFQIRFGKGCQKY